jgi:cell division septation protein DedD
MFGKRRLSALAAVVALAALAGALGGALATAGLTHFAGGDSAAPGNLMLEASVARIDADILALKASVEHTTKMGMSQFNKTSDRLDRVEKAQAEPAAKLAKLSEAVDKLRATPPAAAVPVAAAPATAKDVTGSIAPPAAAAAPVPLPAPKPEVARLPTVEGWVLRDVDNGYALIESRRGMFEVYAGDPIPGLGRVDAIRKQDGRWVVVTSKGLIVAR